MQALAQTGGPVSAVLFDLDGTLVWTRIDFQAMRAAVCAVAAEAGVAAEAIAGLDVLAMAARAADIVAATAGQSAAERLRVRAEQAMVAAEMLGLQDAGPAPYAAEVLSSLRQRGMGIGIVTRNCRRATDAVLASTGLEGHSVVLTREDVARCKPDPSHLLEALHRLSVPPQAAVMVGDHTMDVQAGQAAGMRTVGVLTPGRPADFFDPVGPDLVAGDLRDLLPFLDNWAAP